MALAGNTIALTIDLSRFPPVAAAWKQPVDLSVYPITNGYPDPYTGGGLIQYQRQDCIDRTANTTSATELAAPPTSATTSPPAAPSQTERSSESAESEVGDLFAGMPADPGSCADGGICQLSAPSGNYYCTISRVGAFCSPPLGEPLTAGVDARLISVGADGETQFLTDSGGNSHTEDRGTMSEFTLPYGNTVTAYGMTCAFRGSTGGASCRHDASEHGFTIDPAQYRFF
ncbi:hypothetical protein HQ602_18735 [Rhodococcus kroppenstedtii]|uniref:hypothetical protein n=1 Tax=Rhodococcoides kroppenstedtii TaxID=293050 RepID=UPI001C9B0A8F|nr:hypothetical protein [Rhodococcus kroppenstedtii]MBY6438412.1 hypothetical protein [Rhodococcus kroppenstedtii]